MARQNRWVGFAQAFNAVYDTGTTIARDFETLKILNKDDEDYKDADGNSLSGAGLTRAKADALAGIEQKYGSARDALAIRTGAEDYITKGLNNQYLTNTLDERSRTPGLENANLQARTGYTNSATGLNAANTQRVSLANDFNSRTLDRRVEAENATRGMTTARDTAQGAYYGSDQYGLQLDAQGRQATSEADLAATTAGVQADVAKTDFYRDGVFAEARRTATVAQIRNALTQDPRFREQMDADFETQFNQSMANVANSRTDLSVAQDPSVQDARFTAGLANAQTASADAQSGALTAQRNLQANQWITDWSKTADPRNPASMASLVEGLKRISPEMGMQLEQGYGEHELWRIANESLVFKAGANQALSEGGVAGLESFMEDKQFSGDRDAVDVQRGEDGSIRMVEAGTGRVISEGADEKEFMQNLQGYLDPATMLEISKQQYDNQLTSAQAEYNRAQARAKGTLTMDSFIAQRLSQNPNDPLALTLAFRNNPESISDILSMSSDNALINQLNGGGDNNGIVPNPTATAPAADPAAVPFNTGMGEQEQIEARAQVTELLQQPGLSVEQRAAIVQSNPELLQSMGLYQPEVAKLALAEAAVDAIGREDVATALTQIGDIIANPPAPARGIASRNNTSGQQLERAQALQQAMQDPEMLQILIADFRARADQLPTDQKGYSGKNAKTRQAKMQNQIAELEQLLATATQSGGLGGGR